MRIWPVKSLGVCENRVSPFRGELAGHDASTPNPAPRAVNKHVFPTPPKTLTPLITAGYVKCPCHYLSLFVSFCHYLSLFVSFCQFLSKTGSKTRVSWGAGQRPPFVAFCYSPSMMFTCQQASDGRLIAPAAPGRCNPNIVQTPCHRREEKWPQGAPRRQHPAWPGLMAEKSFRHCPVHVRQAVNRTYADCHSW
jgi:hypothetical protein